MEKAIRAQHVPDSFETGSGFALTGTRVLAVWAGSGVAVGRGKAEGWWHVGTEAGTAVAPLASSAPIIIECDDGGFVATVAMPRFIASILYEAGGASAVVYRSESTTSGEVDITARALAELERGSLRADAKTDLAVELRRAKHADPVLGCISAYLYDSVGDVDSIRRMAWAYIEHGQPIPYDIALLGQLEGQWQSRMLIVKVPAVAQREPRTPAEQGAPWTYAATRETRGEVGGRWPWLRQGWAFLDDPLDVELTLIQREMLEVRPRLRRSRFSTFDAQGGHRLAQVFGLTRWTG